MSNELLSPLPGDTVYAVHRMRAWENDHERGVDGVWVEPEQVALVIEVKRVSRGKTRLRVLTNQRVVLFSCYTRDLVQNWRVVSRQLPSSGSR
jgi:hypothetical protein